MRSLECLTPGFSVDGIPILNRSSRIRLLPSSGQTDLQSLEGVLILNGDLIQGSVVNAHPLSSILLFHKEGAPQGDELGRINPLA
jgi:hypothetical protein